MKILIPFLTLVLSFLATTAFAQKYSNEFLSIGVGARAQGLGNAVVANIQDVTAAAWNPAGLAAIDLQGLQLGDALRMVRRRRKI